MARELLSQYPLSEARFNFKRRYTKVKIAYVGDFIGHGKSLPTNGTSLTLLLSKINSVDQIDVYCPTKTEDIKEYFLPSNIRIIESYQYNDPRSIFGIFSLRKGNYNRVIFNILPTSFGTSSLSNFLGLISPIILRKFFGMRNLEIIFHNSVFTNDFKKLGYGSLYDKMRASILRRVERLIFRNINTFVLLTLYKKRIDTYVKNNLVSTLNERHVAGVTTTFLNNRDSFEVIYSNPDPNNPTILLHGSWGPQKNLELGLSVLRNLREEGYKFKVILSGNVNHHFPIYEEKFLKTLERYKAVVDQYCGYVDEKDVFKLFTEADLLLLPYNTPGGISEVMYIAMFFDLPTVAVDFPEYREQTRGAANIKLVSEDEFYNAVKNFMPLIGHKRKIYIKNKISEAMENIKSLLEN